MALTEEGIIDVPDCTVAGCVWPTASVRIT